jgi:hypothetical protein
MRPALLDELEPVVLELVDEVVGENEGILDDAGHEGAGHLGGAEIVETAPRERP